MNREELIRTIKIWEVEHGRICLRQSVEQFLDKLKEYQYLPKEEVGKEEMTAKEYFEQHDNSRLTTAQEDGSYLLLRYVFDLMEGYANLSQPRSGISMSSEEEFEIDFGGACKCKIIIDNNKMEVVAAMDGWGRTILNQDISVTKLNQEEK